MNWITSFSFLLILFLTQHVSVDSRGEFGAPTKSPWADKSKANNFMRCLIQNIAISAVFPQQEKEDLESIVETMMSAISNMKTTGNNHAQLQAINMAFASSMAELVVAEDVGNMQAVAIKTDALAQTLKTCFQNVMGDINNKFINEIKDLIQVFAKEAAANDSENEISNNEQGYSSNTSSRQTTSQTQYSTTQQVGSTNGGNNIYGFGTPSLGTGPSAPGYGTTGPAFAAGPPTPGYGPAGTGLGAAGPSGPSGALSGITNTLASALASSTTFKSIFRSGVSSQLTVRIATSALQSTLSSTLGVDASTSSRISSDLQSSLLSLGEGADVSSVAMAVSKTVVAGLSSSGLLTADNASDIGVNLASGLIQAASGIAAQYGIRISQSDVSSDISSVTSILRSSSTTSQATSVTSVSSVGQTSQDWGSSAGTSGLGAGAPLYLGAPGYGAGPSTPGYGPVGPGLGAAGPSVTSGALSGITNTLVSALASSTTFKSIFRSGVSSQLIVLIATSALQSTLSSTLRVDASTSSRISSDLQSSLLSLGAGADVSSVAMAVSTTVVSGLSSSGLLTADNASDIGVNLASGLIQAASGIAAQYGIRVSQSDVSSDISSVTSILRSSSTTSQTTSVTSISSVGQTSQDWGSSAGTSGLGAGAPLDLGAPGYGAGSSVPSGVSVLSSPSGLTSAAAVGRIQSLSKQFLNAVGTRGLNVDSITQSLALVTAEAINSGLSESDAKIEVLLEALVSLIQILSSAQIGSVNLSATSSLSSSLASSLFTIWA